MGIQVSVRPAVYVERAVKNQVKFFKNNPDDHVWWLDTTEDGVGEFVFSFDKKTEFNLFRDYPHKLTPEQKQMFDEENPYWKYFFSERK